MTLKQNQNRSLCCDAKVGNTRWKEVKSEMGEEEEGEAREEGNKQGEEWYGALNRNGHHRLMCLNAWS